VIPPPVVDEKPGEETKDKESELMQKNTEPATEVDPKDKDIDEVSREEVDSLAAMSFARAVNDFR
jgi:myo-inositol-1-phosphate synthase